MRTITLIILSMSFIISNALSPLTMLVGTYNEPGQPGVYVFEIDPDNKISTLVDTIDVQNPSFLSFNPSNTKQMFVISELSNDDSMVSLYNFEPNDKINFVNAVHTDGSPCYVSCDGDNVVTANYGGGTVNVFGLTADNMLSKLLHSFYGSVGGPDSVRQALPHIHCVIFSPDGKRLYATDFSSDRILYFLLDETTREISPETIYEEGAEHQRVTNLSADTGPRHIVFDAQGKHAYLIGELSGMITVFDVESNGELKEVQTIDADEAHRRGSSHISLSNDGRHLYVSNRLGSDGIVCFNVNPDNGLLSNAGHVPTGLHPRHFAITPDDKYLFVACRDENRIELYARDKETGTLTRYGLEIPVAKPVFVVFRPQ